MPRIPTPVVDRIMARIVKDEESGCWNWPGATDGKGYGKIRTGSPLKTRRTHRLVFEALRGVVPGGMELDHLCRNRGCCNPDHLRVVTHRENVLAGESRPAQQARRARCHAGHFLPAQIKPGRKGRECEECARRRAEEQREKQARPGGSRAHCFVPRKTHCLHGHLLAEPNLIISKAGRRCRACVNAKTLARYHAKKRAD